MRHLYIPLLLDRTRRLTSWAGSATLVLLLAIHLTPLTHYWARALAGNWTDGTGKTLVVPAAELESDGVLGPSTHLRTLYALRVYRESPFQTIIVTGGSQSNPPHPAGEAMRAFLIANGVPPSVVRAENQSASTRENATYTRRLLGSGAGSIVLLTSDYHMFRARRCFEKAGLRVIPRPVPDVLKRSNRIVNRWISFWTLVLETGKIGYYRWNGWI
jgi:uncharacterized SAM-binding protein YcdF (DUF218 family)